MSKLFIKILVISFVSVFLLVGTALADPINPNRPLTLANSDLQTIFNDNIIIGSLDAEDDQSDVAIWTEAEANIDSYLITLVRGLDDVFNLGIYSYASGAEYDFTCYVPE
ncbi:hypothetical protein H8E88_28840 [candidate division KSB1 bacterium]|nr:hypothetical protein [candidate division KSB1 bacterium]